MASSIQVLIVFSALIAAVCYANIIIPQEDNSDDASPMLLFTEGPFRDAFKARYPVCFHWMEEKLKEYNGSLEKLAQAIDNAEPLDTLSLEFMAYCLLIDMPHDGSSF